MTSEIAIIVALILGPALAVGLFLWRTETDRAYQRRLAVFHALLQNRRRWLSPEWVSALNLTIIEFSKHPEVLTAADALFEKFGDSAWKTQDARRQRIVLDTESAVCSLLQRVADALNLNLKSSDLRNRSFAPLGWNLEDVQEHQLREATLQVMQGVRSIRVEMAQPAAAAAPAMRYEHDYLRAAQERAQIERMQAERIHAERLEAERLQADRLDSEQAAQQPAAEDARIPAE